MYDDRNSDMQSLFSMNLDAKITTERWPFVPSEFRKYDVIEDYVPNPYEYGDAIKEKLKTEKKYYFS